MRKCSGCGNELPENAKFCPHCGSAYVGEETPAAVDTNVNAEKSICEQCGLELPEGAKFCTVCGGMAIKGVSLLKPTAPVMTASASSSGMMQSVSVEEMMAEAAPAPAGVVTPVVPNVQPIAKVEPVIAPEPVVPSISETAEDAFIPEMGAIPEVGIIPEVGGSVAEMDVKATPSVYSTMTASNIEATPSVSSTMGAPTVAPVAPVTPVQPVVQPVQPVANNVISNTLPNTGTVNTLPNTAATNTLPGNTAPNAGVAMASTVDYSKMQPVQKKKTKIGAKIAIAAASLVGAVAIAAGVFFVADKATFLSTILGKEKYAVMVESQSIQKTAETIDTQGIVDGVETLSSALSAIYTISGESAMPMNSAIIGGADGATEVMLYSGSTANSAPMMSAATATAPSGMDIGAYVKMLNKLYVDTYGANGIKMDMTVDVEVRDGLKSLIGGEDVPVDDIVALLNGMSVSYDVTAGEKAADVTMGAKVDTLEVDCRVVMADDNKMYLALPFVSEKAFCVEMPKPENGTGVPEEVPVLKLEKAELDRIVKEIVETYLMKYKESAIEMESGSVEIAGEKFEGKAITAEFAEDKLVDLFESIFTIIAEDEYLCDTIVNYANELGAEFTAEDYKTGIMDSISFEADPEDKLIITTIIDKKGNVLAKTYTAEAEDDEAVFGYAVSDTRSILEVIYNDESGEEKEEVTFTFVDTKKDETSGDIEVSVIDGEEEMSYNITYANAGVKEFCGQQVPVGTYTFTFEMPESFEEQLGEEGFAAINGLTIEVSQTVEGNNAATSSVAVDVEKYGRIGFAMNMTVQDNGEPTVPTNVIDITDAMNSGEPDEQTMNELKAYMDEFGKVYDDKFVPFFEKYKDTLFAGEVPEFSNPFDQSFGPGTGEDETFTAEELKAFIAGDKELLNQYYLQIPANNTDLQIEATSIAMQYASIENQLSGELTEEQLATLSDAYWEVYLRLVGLESALDPEEGEGGFEALSPDVDIDSISKMQYTEVAVVINQCNAAFTSYEIMYLDKIENDRKLKQLYDAADYARIDLESDWKYFADQLNRGSININLLTTARNSLKEYLTAIRALEAELAKLG